MVSASANGSLPVGLARISRTPSAGASPKESVVTESTADFDLRCYVPFNNPATPSTVALLI